MAAIRDVITRFRLETNEADFRGFNQKLGAIKSGLSNVASAFGVTLGVAGGVALTRMGYAAERTRFGLQLLAGDGIGRVDKAIRQTRIELEAMHRGLSGVVSTKSWNEAAANFVKSFGTAEDKLDTFREIMKFATVQSEATGKNVAEIAKSLQDAIEHGGLDALMAVPGFDARRKEITEFMQKPWGEMTPWDALALRGQFVTNLMRKTNAEMRDKLKLLPGDVLQADRAAASLEETLESIGKLLARLVSKILPDIIALLEKITKKVSGIIDEAAKLQANPLFVMLGGALGKLPGVPQGVGPTAVRAMELQKGWTDYVSVLDKVLTNKDWNPTQKFAAWMKLLGPVPPFRPGTPAEQATAAGALGTANAQTVINNEFNIYGAEALSIGREIMNYMNRQLNDARTSMPPTDRR